MPQNKNKLLFFCIIQNLIVTLHSEMSKNLYMSNKEIQKFSEKLKHGLELAEKRMLQEKALHGEDIVVSVDGKTIERIPAQQIIAENAISPC